MGPYPQGRVDNLNCYLEQGLGQVWAQSSKEAINRALKLDRLLWERGVDGGVAEIGVLEGAFLIGLMCLAPSWSIPLAIDCFDLPDYTPDPAGHGFGRASREKFLRNVESWAPDPGRLILIEADSSTVTVDRLRLLQHRERVSRVKIFSVDGLHTREATLHDLRLAEELLVDGGVIVVDDYLNDGCPGVAEGVHEFLKEWRFEPIGMGDNKVYLARRGFNWG